MIVRRLLPLLCSSALVGGCPEPVVPEAPLRFDPAALGGAITLLCPGDPSGRCDFSDSAELTVGAAAIPITPAQWETWIDEDGDRDYKTSVDTYLDCGGDRLCPGDDGYPGPDLWEGNGLFDAMWLAGFGNGRPMQAVADDIWARATVLRQGNTTLGVVTLDVVGFFYDQVEEIRAAAALALDLDHVIVVSTHVHEAPDTMGIWGPQIAYSGVNAEFMSHIHSQVADALQLAAASAVPADLFVGHHQVADEAWGGSGINNINLDTRDPNVTDPNFWTARFVARGTDDTIATWVNWPNHPEASGSENILLTSDFVHTLRLTVEEGASEGPQGAMTGVGGVTLFLSGAVGGMQSPLHCDTIDLDGVTVHSVNDLPKAYAVGRVAGYHALQAIEDEELAPAPALAFRTKQLMAPVENRGYHLMFQLGVLDRDVYDYDPNALINDSNTPKIRTEVSVLTLGPLGVATVPGEPFPELAIGGYDGRWTGPLQELVEPGNTHPPDLAAAPQGPYLVDRLLSQPGRTHTMEWGLATDGLGYLMPDYDYVLHATSPYLNEAPGDHYEETNSLGVSAQGILVGGLETLLDWQVPARP